jgi:diaminopimelate epimerase
MRLIKYEGLGNKFLVAITEHVPIEGRELAQSLCDSRNGYDVDGLIFGTPILTDDIDIQMTLFNADGTLAEISGNGIRCLAQEVFIGSNTAGTLRILTGSGVRNATLNSRDGDQVEIEVDMGTVREGPELPLLDFLNHQSVSVVRAQTADIGNPHVVIEVVDLDRVEVAEAGAHIESLWQPGGINVHFIEVRTPNVISMLHWERGVGITQACGSGAAAGSYVAYKWGLVAENVSVEMPGGIASVSIRKDKVYLTGQSVRLAEFEVSTDG